MALRSQKGPRGHIPLLRRFLDLLGQRLALFFGTRNLDYRLLELSGVVWDSLELFGTLSGCLGLSGAVWDSLELFGTLSGCLGLSGAVWDSLELFGTLSGCLGLSGVVWQYYDIFPSGLRNTRLGLI